MQKLVNAYVKTLKWIQDHTAAQITDKMPADYYSGVGKAAYITGSRQREGHLQPDRDHAAERPADQPEGADHLQHGRQGQEDRPQQDLHRRVRAGGQVRFGAPAADPWSAQCPRGTGRPVPLTARGRASSVRFVLPRATGAGRPSATWSIFEKPQAGRAAWGFSVG